MPRSRPVCPSACGLVIVLLVLSVGVAVAGMSQPGLLFQRKGAADSMAAPGAPGPGLPAPGPGGPGGANMQYYTSNNPQFQQFKPTPVPLERESTEIKLDLKALYGDEQDRELRRYQATFEGKYVVRRKKTEDKQQQDQDGEKKPDKLEVIVFFPFPGSADTIPQAVLKVDGHEPDKATYRQAGVSCELSFEPEQKHEIIVSYKAHGTEDFVYMLDHDERIRKLTYAVTMSGVQRKPTLPPKECLEPTKPLTRQGDTWTVAWDESNLLTQRDIVIQIPAPLVGSDIAHRMPNLMRVGVVSLVLFGLLLASGGVITDRRLSLGQYVLVALPIAMFYPLLLQLSKYMSLTLAFALAFVLMGALVMANLRRSQGSRFAFTYGLFGLIVIVGLFALAALLTKGAGAVVTIAVFLLVAYLVYAAPKLPMFQPRPKPEPRIPLPPPPPTLLAETEEDDETAAQTEEKPAAVAPAVAPTSAAVAPPPTPHHYCAYCGREVEDTFTYCPGCGRQAKVSHQCECGADLCDACTAGYAYCPGCGRKLSEG